MATPTRIVMATFSGIRAAAGRATTTAPGTPLMIPIASSRSMPSRTAAGREISAPPDPRGARAAGAEGSTGAATVSVAADGATGEAGVIAAGTAGAGAERHGRGEAAASGEAPGPGVAAVDGRARAGANLRGAIVKRRADLAAAACGVAMGALMAGRALGGKKH